MAWRRQLEFVRAWAWLAVLGIVVGSAVAFVFASQIPPTYSSQASILIGPPLGGVINNGDIQVGQSLRQTYADLATTRPLLRRAIASTGVDTTPEKLAEAVTARAPSGSSLLILEVTDADPTVASTLANAIAAELAKYPATSSDTTPSPNVTLTVVDPAVPPTSPSSRGPLFSAALGAAIGLAFAVVAASVVESLRKMKGGVAEAAPAA